jgi:hypothetical protein
MQILPVMLMFLQPRDGEVPVALRYVRLDVAGSAGIRVTQIPT